MIRSVSAVSDWRVCIAVIGPGEGATTDAVRDGEDAGRHIARRGWVTLCGGRAVGVMDAAARGANEEKGIVVGFLPGTDKSEAARTLTIALPTGLGEARNAVLVSSADAVVACGVNPGTASEIALSLNARKPIALIRPTPETAGFFASLTGGDAVYVATDAGDAISWIAMAIG
jgi:uncharacterized protein (TIGR00725 family)